MKKFDREAQELEEKLRLQIRNCLRKSRADNYSCIFKETQKPDGYIIAENMILDYAIRNQVSVRTAMKSIEETLK